MGGRPPGERAWRLAAPGGRAAAERALHAQREVVQLERLLEVVACATAQRLDRGVEAGVAGHEDDREARLQRTRAFEHVESVQTRHLDVAQHDVELLPGDAGQRLLAGPRGGDLVALRVQQRLDRVLDHRLVVDDENGCAHTTSARVGAR